MEIEFLKTFFSNRPIGNDFILMLVSFCFVAMGISAFIKPTFITKQFDIHTLSVSGKNEVRAVYGGFGIFMSLSLVISLMLPEIRNGVCLNVAFALFGMSFGRILSTMIDGTISKLPFFYGSIELLASILILFT